MVSASATSLIETLIHTGALDRSSLFDVSGWVAVVTGGGTGLGLVSAVTLATNGCIVYIVGRRLEPLEKVVSDFADAADKKGKGSIHAIQADVSTKEGVDELLAFVNGREGHINLLLNNHGVSLGCADINSCEQTAEGLSEQMYNGESMDKWLDTYRINTASYFFTTFAFLPLLAAAGKSGEFAQPGNVINISSISGLTKTSQRGQFNYNASKAATVSLSHMMAYEFARRNLEIRVNVIAPGYFPSGMTVIPKESNDGSDSAYRDFRNNWAIPFGRPGSAADHAQAILSVATNQYMTGAEIVVDGGWMLESAF